MDAGQIISTIVLVLFGGGGAVAWYKAHGAKKVGMSGVEVQDKSAATADWDALSKYWEGELASVRGEVAELKAEVKHLREERQRDTEAHATERRLWFAERDHLNAELDKRDRWIYEGKPPPPPPRRAFPPAPTEPNQ